MVKDNGDNSVLDGFTDSSKISDYAVNYVSLLINEGLIKGSNNEIVPQNKTRRAEVAVLLYRVYNKMIK